MAHDHFNVTAIFQNSHHVTRFNTLQALLFIGINERGEKHFLGIEDGVRESTQSWREVLLKLKSRGMNSPEVATGDGVMGFWEAFDLFIKTYKPKYPKATLCLKKDREELLTFYDFPAQHWQSLRTSNPNESTLAPSAIVPSDPKAACPVMACCT